MFAAQFFKFDKPRRLATSGGLGTMGYGLPASMGACLAYPDRLVVNIDGDGSMLMNIQELATIHVERLPVKCIILNNQHLGMVVQWEDLKYDSNRPKPSWRTRTTIMILPIKRKMSSTRTIRLFVPDSASSASVCFA